MHQNSFPRKQEKQGTSQELHRELWSICLEDDVYLKTVHRWRGDSELPAKKKTLETNNFKFFLEWASISNFCWATNQKK